MVREIIQFEYSRAMSIPLVLKERSAEVLNFDSRFENSVQDLKDTLLAHPIAIGLAAPQLGENKRIAVVNISEAKSGPTLVITNPRELMMTGKKDHKKESCMSIPHWRGDVERRSNLSFVYEDETGQTKRMSASGFLARVLCHEIDHLDGVLYIDRMVRPIRLDPVKFFSEGERK
jgi:peptide deformylase